ncbi:MAG: hypothetical protein Q4D91_05120 [Lautropia sp.]|nr:hypothetical protein [Lautropia sp.]
MTGSETDKKRILRKQPAHGIDWPPSRRLHAGDFSATFDRGDIAQLSMRGHELIRLIYVAVRDPAWHTIPATPLSVHLDAGPTPFSTHVHARSTGASLDLAWHLDVTGFPDGRLQADFRATARRDCDFARIGLCIHFDAARFSQACWVSDGDAGSRTGRFPTRIHPQHLVDGIHLPCIPAFSSMRISLDTDTSLDIRLEGDLFEIEDQRNWTDASFKAYTTPLSLGELHHLAAGDTIRQRLHLSMCVPEHAAPTRRPILHATALGPLRQGLPELGVALSLAAHEPAPPSAIPFTHRRFDVRSEADIAPLFARIESMRGTQGIELVLHHEALPDPQLDQLLTKVGQAGPLSRLILLGDPEHLPSPTRVLAVKAMTRGMPDGLSIGAGGDDAYADLARDPNDFAPVDFVAFPMSPQHHVFDTRSIFETLAVQAQVVREARQRTASGRVAISALTFGTQAFESQADSAQPHRDQRLRQVGAAWLAGSLGHLALGGATSITLAPDLWMTEGLPPSLTTLLQTFTCLNRARLVPFEIDDAHRVFLFGARQNDETIVFLINLGEQQQMVHLSGLGQGDTNELQAQHDANTPDAACPAPPVNLASPIRLAPYQLRILRHRQTSRA